MMSNLSRADSRHRALAAFRAQPVRAVRGALRARSKCGARRRCSSAGWRAAASRSRPRTAKATRSSATPRSSPRRSRIVALRFVDNAARPTEAYPFNANGSPRGHHRPHHRRRPLHDPDAAPGARVPHRADVVAPGRLGRGFAVDADVPQRAARGSADRSAVIVDTGRPPVDPASASADHAAREDVAMSQIERGLRRCVAWPRGAGAGALRRACRAGRRTRRPRRAYRRLPQPLTKESIRELVARLSDDEVRKLLLDQLDRAAAAAPASAKAGNGDVGHGRRARRRDAHDARRARGRLLRASGHAARRSAPS